jgi:Beta-propeller repeat
LSLPVCHDLLTDPYFPISPGNDIDEAAAIAIDDSGNVYVTGKSIGTNTFFDFATVKYDSGGQEDWVVRYNGLENLDDSAAAIAVDDSGNVYVTGSSYVNLNYDYTTIKYAQGPTPTPTPCTGRCAPTPHPRPTPHVRPTPR